MQIFLVSSLLIASHLPLITAIKICGARGYSGGTNAYGYGDGYQNAYVACSQMCRESSSCRSFAYGSNDCYTFDVAVDGNLEKDEDSPYKFYDVGCVKPASTSISSSRPVSTTTKVISTTSSTSSTRISTTSVTSSTSLFKVTTTSGTSSRITTPTTTANTITKTSTSSSACAIDARPSCAGGTVRDPCSQGCGCTYAEGCGGSIRPSTTDRNSVLFHLTGVSYSSCVRTCDTNQPDCIGVNYSPNGDCYGYRSMAGTGPAPGAWVALRDSCDGACKHAGESQFR